MTMIHRDPFARTELHRRVVETGNTCSWCGIPRFRGDKPVKGPRGYRLFRYRTESDGGSWSEHRGEFCSLLCFHSWHGVH